MDKPTITFSTPHGLQPGTIVKLAVPDHRWWRRLLHRLLLRRGMPMRWVQIAGPTPLSGTAVVLGEAHATDYPKWARPF